MNLAKIKNVVSAKNWHYKQPWPWLLGFVVYSLLGFFLVPYLIKTNIQKFTFERLQATTQIESVRFNPWMFALTINNLNLTDNSGKDVLGFERFYVNFQSTSLFRWAWSFDEVHLLGFYSTFERLSDSESNFSRLATTFAETQVTAAEPEPQEEQASELNDGASIESASAPRLFIKDVQLQISRITLIDHVPATTFQKDIGPIDLQVVELSTLPNRVGQQEVNIVTRQGAHISWSGDISITPLASKGQVTIEGPHLNVVTEYLQDNITFTVDKGLVEAQFTYDFSLAGETPSLSIDELNLSLKDFLYVDKVSRAPLFSWQELALKNGSLKIPQQEVHVDAVDFVGGQVWVSRDQTGEINLNHLFSFPATPPLSASNQGDEENVVAQDSEPTEPDQPMSWQLSNDVFALRNWQVHFTDEQLAEPATIDVTDINVEVKNGSNLANQAINVNSNLTVAEGAIAAAASLNINPVANIDAEYSVRGIELAVLQPYLASVANAKIESGALSASGNINAKTPTQAQINAATNLENLLIKEKGSEATLLSWRNFDIDKALFDMGESSLVINNIVFDEFYTDFAIDQNGGTTVDRILLASEPSEQEGPPLEQAQSEPVADSNAPSAMAINVGNIAFKGMSAQFADASLPLPFSTSIKSLDGNISSLVSNSSTPAEIDLQGQVDDYGAVTVKGQLAAFAPTEYAQVSLAFRNIDVPDMSPYSIKFAGREIDNGRMDLSLNYNIKAGILDSKNSVVLYDLELGERVEQPGALDLPLDLALALLKDGDGKINVTLPVSGDVNDPKFGVGSVIGQAIVAVIRNIVASPFRLLANLVGLESEDLSYIRFEVGEGTLTPPEVEKIHQLAAALQQRPNLALKISGVYAKQDDSEALKTKQFDVSLVQQLGEDNANAAKTSQPYIKALEQRYSALALAPALAELKPQYTTAGEQDSKPSLDVLSYVNALRERLIALEEVDSESLQILASQRRLAVQQEFLAVSSDLSSQLQEGETDAGDVEDNWVEMKLELVTD